MQAPFAFATSEGSSKSCGRDLQFCSAAKVAGGARSAKGPPAPPLAPRKPSARVRVPIGWVWWLLDCPSLALRDKTEETFELPVASIEDNRDQSQVGGCCKRRVDWFDRIGTTPR